MTCVVLPSYDVVFTAGVDIILSRFKDFNCRVVFSAEGFCWPDETLAVSGSRVISMIRCSVLFPNKGNLESLAYCDFKCASAAIELTMCC